MRFSPNSMTLTGRSKPADGADEVQAPVSRPGVGGDEGDASVHPEELWGRDVDANIQTAGLHVWKSQAVPAARVCPGELSDFGGLSFREALSGQHRVIYAMRGDTIYIHVVTDHAVLYERFFRNDCCVLAGKFSVTGVFTLCSARPLARWWHAVVPGKARHNEAC